MRADLLPKLVLDNLSEQEDVALVALTKQELPYVTRAYEELMRRHYRLMYNACLVILRNPSEAQDACQDILLKVFMALQRFDGRASFKTWLMKITTNTCITRSQKRKLESERFVENNAAVLQEPDPGGGPEASLQASFEVLVQSLSNEDRQLLTLRFVGGLSLPEIGKVMSLGLSAAKMRYYRALEKLKKEER